MNKEAYKFDEKFLDLIENGSRHELAMYRNRIIDELEVRTKQNQAKKIASLLGATTSKEQKTVERHYRVMALVFSVFAIFGTGLAIISLIDGKILMTIFDVLIVIINTLNVFIYKQKQKIASALFMPEAVIITNNTNSSIINDDTEILERKKARLDDILGF